jgi:Secretion system C-terminal sorting domain
MNTLYRIFKTQLLLVVVLFGATFSYAQTVSVPANCRVVVTNTAAGGVLGFGGKVTDGGMVAMPDAILVLPTDVALTTNQGGKFTFNPPVTTITTATWLLKGDISNKTNSGTITGVIGNYNTVSQPPANLSADIFSYNKSYRPNTTETQNPSFARSKGLVRVGYDQTGCGKSMSFEIFKTFTEIFRGDIPRIVGPSCLKPNTIYTYSVDRIVSDNTPDNIGFDSYYWSGLPNSLLSSSTYYTSADTSSITFTTGTSVAAFVLECCFGRVNPNTADGGLSTVLISAVPGAHTTCTSKQIIIAPVAPVITPALSATVANCISTGTASTSYSFPTISGQTYLWTASNPTWILTQSVVGANYNLSINFNGDNNPGKLTLKITGSCDPVEFNYQINRTLATGLGITGLLGVTATTCINAATSYSLPQNALGNFTTWSIDTVPSGGVLPVGAPTLNTATAAPNSTCTVTPGTASGQFSLVATSNTATSCTSTNTRITINMRPATPVITGSNCVQRNGLTTPLSYSCTTIAGCTGYTWTFPAGWLTSNSTNTITVAGAANSSVAVTPAGTTTSGTISVTANGVSGASCDSVVATLAVNYQPIAPSTFTPACWIVGSTSTTAVTIGNNPGYGTYTFTSTPATLFSGTTTFNASDATFNIPTTGTGGNYSITVTHSNGTTCNNQATTFNNVAVGSAGTISMISVFNASQDNYIINGAPALSTFSWTIAPNTTIVGIASSLTLTGNGTPPAPGTVCCNVTVPGGCVTNLCSTAINPIHSLRQGATSTFSDSNDIIDGVSIFPNPNNGVFFIKVETIKDTATATLNDFSGKEIATYSLKKGTNKIGNDELPKGTYIVVLKVDGKQESRQVIIR